MSPFREIALYHPKVRIANPQISSGSGAQRPGYRPTRVLHATVPSGSGPACKHTAKFDRRRPHFSNFGPPAAPTLATLLAAGIEDLFAEAPVGAGWGPRRTLAHRGPRRPTLAGLVPICARHTLADLTPKYPTLATSTPGCPIEKRRARRVAGFQV